MKKRYFLRVCYKGDPFHGFQSQSHGQTVQDTLERALEVFFRKPVKVLGASRTDTKVHAREQWAVFSLDENPFPFDSFRWLQGMNALTPPELGITFIKPVDENFHPIQEAKAKFYVYRLWEGPCYDPWYKSQVWSIRSPMDVDRLRETLAPCQGYKDFKNFSDPDAQTRTTFRLIYEIQILRNLSLIEIWFSGQGFLKHMIRRIVGSAVSMVIQNKSPSSMGDKSLIFTAPPQGLTLMKIFPCSPPPLNIFFQAMPRHLL